VRLKRFVIRFAPDYHAGAGMEGTIDLTASSDDEGEADETNYEMYVPIKHGVGRGDALAGAGEAVRKKQEGDASPEPGADGDDDDYISLEPRESDLSPPPTLAASLDEEQADVEGAGEREENQHCQHLNPVKPAAAAGVVASTPAADAVTAVKAEAAAAVADSSPYSASRAQLTQPQAPAGRTWVPNPPLLPTTTETMVSGAAAAAAMPPPPPLPHGRSRVADASSDARSDVCSAVVASTSSLAGGEAKVHSTQRRQRSPPSDRRSSPPRQRSLSGQHSPAKAPSLHDRSPIPIDSGVGFVFHTAAWMEEECLSKAMVVGPWRLWNTACEIIVKGTPILLYNFNTGLIMGIFSAEGPPRWHDRCGFRGRGGGESMPVQVCVQCESGSDASILGIAHAKKVRCNLNDEAQNGFTLGPIDAKVLRHIRRVMQRPANKAQDLVDTFASDVANRRWEYEPSDGSEGCQGSPAEPPKGRGRGGGGEDEACMRGADFERDRSDGFDARQLLARSLAGGKGEDTEEPFDRSGNVADRANGINGSPGDGLDRAGSVVSDIHVSQNLKDLVTQILYTLTLPCHPKIFFKEFKTTHGDTIQHYVSSKPVKAFGHLKALDIVRAMPDVVMLVPQPGKPASNTTLYIHIADVDWSISGPPIDQLKENMRKVFAQHCRPQAGGSYEMGAIDVKKVLSEVVRTRVPLHVKIYALVTRLSEGTDEWTIVTHKSKRGATVVWKKGIQDHEGGIRAAAEAEGFLSSMQPQEARSSPDLTVREDTTITAVHTMGVGRSQVPSPPLSNFLTQPMALGGFKGLQTSVVPPAPLSTMRFQPPASVVQASSSASAGTTLEPIAYSDKEDSIVVADLRRRIVNDEVLPALVRVMQKTLDFPTASDIFNRWFFTLSAKNCAVENERSAPTLLISVRGRGGRDDDGPSPSGNGGGGENDEGGGPGAGRGRGRVAQWKERSASFAQELDPLIPCSVNTMSRYMADVVTIHPGVNREMLRALTSSGTLKVQEAIDLWATECKRLASQVAAAAAAPESALPSDWTDASVGIVEGHQSADGLVRLHLRFDPANPQRNLCAVMVGSLRTYRSLGRLRLIRVESALCS